MRRRSALSEAAELLADLVVNGSRTICFLRSRRGIELIQRFARMRLEERGEPDLAARIAPYRAGYTPQQRREIEAQPRARRPARGRRDRRARARASTSASSTPRSASPSPAPSRACGRCGAGRAGAREGLALYVAGEDALDQFFCRHPDEFLARPVEAAILDHANERIQTAHLLAAAYEAPLGGTATQPGGADDEILGERWRERADALVGAGKLRRGARRPLPAARARAFPPARSRCARRRSTRSRSSTRASGEMLGTVEAERAFTTVHPGAIYLHLGRSYEVARARRRRPPRDRRRLRRRLVHAAEEGDEGLHRGDRRRSAAIGPPRRRRALLGRGLGHRAGDRLPAQEPRPTTR